MGRSASGADGELKPLIRRALRENRTALPLDPEAGPAGFLRVSGLASLCAREEALCARMRKVREDVVEADLSLIFEHGDALHWDLQNRVLPKTRTLHGRWLCGSCGARHGGEDRWDLPFSRSFAEAQLPRPETCPSCGTALDSSNSLYLEQFLVDPEYRISGHPDGFLMLDGLKGLGVLEIKSINPRGAWEVRGCPKLDHVVQLQCYMWMTGCRWGKIVYWDKSGQGLGALIEHHIEYDEDQVEAIQNLINSIWDGVTDLESKLPERICESVDCKRAELCSVAASCFKAGD